MFYIVYSLVSALTTLFLFEPEKIIIAEKEREKTEFPML